MAGPRTARRRAWHVRFFPRERRFNASHVHERLEPIEHVVSLRGTVIHHSFRDFAHFVTKVVRYARWGADDLAARGIIRVEQWNRDTTIVWGCRAYLRDGWIWPVLARSYADGKMPRMSALAR